MIIAPAYALLPSARQKSQMVMRREAMGEGIGVELVRIDDPDPDPEKYLSPTGRQLDRSIAVAAYRLPRPMPGGWKKPSLVAWTLVRTGKEFSDLPDGWQWAEGDANELPQVLTVFIENRISRIPDDVIRIDEINGIVSMYWHESDAEGAVGKVIDFLKDCCDLQLYQNTDTED